jgi:hypothetical protein
MPHPWNMLGHLLLPPGVHVGAPQAQPQFQLLPEKEAPCCCQLPPVRSAAIATVLATLPPPSSRRTFDDSAASWRTSASGRYPQLAASTPPTDMLVRPDRSPYEGHVPHEDWIVT